MENCLETTRASVLPASSSDCVSLESEIPEVLYCALKDFINANPQWDQYKLISSALANFLFQNGSEDSDVKDRYLSDLFSRSK